MNQTHLEKANDVHQPRNSYTKDTSTHVEKPSFEVQDQMHLDAYDAHRSFEVSALLCLPPLSSVKGSYPSPKSPISSYVYDYKKVNGYSDYILEGKSNSYRASYNEILPTYEMMQSKWKQPTLILS